MLVCLLCSTHFEGAAACEYDARLRIVWLLHCLQCGEFCTNNVCTYFMIRRSKCWVQLINYHPRMEFCQWFLQRCSQEPDSISTMLFSDESCFIFNSRSSHVWTEENPHFHIIRNHKQIFFSVNMWAGILHYHSIGPYLLPDSLNGQIYYNFRKRSPVHWPVRSPDLTSLDFFLVGSSQSRRL